MSKPTVFLSYNWDSSNKVADDIEMRLNPYANVKRDKKSVGAWGDLTNFMKSIRHQDFAVLIISDAYLKSEGCLFEVIELMKDEHWDKRVMYVVTDDAHGVYNTNKQLEYIRYWNDKESILSEEIKKFDPGSVVEQAKELKKIRLIALNIGSFMAKIKQTNNPVMTNAINEVIKRVEGGVVNTPNIVPIQATDDIKDKVDIVIPDTLHDNWSFHNDIAIVLEMKARHIFGDLDRPYTKIYDADSIETGMFADVMINALREKTGYENDREDVDEFIGVCSRYIGKKGREIDKRVAQGLLNRFLELINNRRSNS